MNQPTYDKMKKGRKRLGRIRRGGDFYWFSGKGKLDVRQFHYLAHNKLHFLGFRITRNKR